MLTNEELEQRLVVLEKIVELHQKTIDVMLRILEKTTSDNVVKNLRIGRN